MSDIVSTTGRPMTTQLRAALDNLTGATRERVIRVLSDPDPGSVTGPIHRAIALELRLAQMREDDTLRGMSRDLSADGPDDPPWPKATGTAKWMDDDGNIVDPPDGLQ